MKFLHAIFVFLLFMSAVMAADELIVNGTAVLGGKIPLKGFSIIQDPITGAGFCFKAPAGRSIGTDFIAIDPTKNYLLSGKFATQGKSGRFVLGFDCFDAKKRKIGAHHIQYVADTQTVLTANADKGSNHILIADGKNWSPAAGKVAVFNVKSDFSDLPNFNTHYYITEVKKVSGAYKVTFSRPLLCNYPAGTSVRLHREAGILNAIAFVQPQKKWETHKALIEKVSTDPAINEHFWPGTRFIISI